MKKEMVQNLPITLSDLYIHKKIEKDTFLKMLRDSHSSVFIRLYNIVNGVKDRQEFLELKDNEYSLSATINTKTFLIGEARDQFSLAKVKKAKQTPHYKIRVILTSNQTGITIFDFEHKTSSKNEVYDLIPLIKKQIDSIWKRKD